MSRVSRLVFDSLRIAGAALFLVPSVARAQNLGGVEYVLLPPVVLAPLLTAVVRMRLRGGAASAPRSLWSALGVAWIELVLWLACLFFIANAWFAGRWYTLAAVAPLVTLVLGWHLNGWWLGARGRGLRVRRLLFVPMVPLALAVLLVLTYAFVAAWDRYA